MSVPVLYHRLNYLSNLILLYKCYSLLTTPEMQITPVGREHPSKPSTDLAALTLKRLWEIFGKILNIFILTKFVTWSQKQKHSKPQGKQ